MLKAKAVSVLFCLLAGTTYGAEIAAKVNGKVITQADVDDFFSRSSVGRQKHPPDQEALYRRHALNLFIDRLLIAQFLDGRGIALPDNMVDEHVAAFAEQLKREKSSLAEFLTERNITDAEMRAEIGDLYRWETFVDTEATETVLRSYFEATRAAFDGSQVRARHVLVKVATNATTTERLAARQKIEAIRAQLAAGTSFADLARRHSDCPSKEIGGDLGFFPRKGIMTEPFAAAAFDLAAGQLSGVVETEFGLHLIQVTETKPGTPVHFDEVASKVRALYAEDLRRSIVARMRQSADIQLASEKAADRR